MFAVPVLANPVVENHSHSRSASIDRLDTVLEPDTTETANLRDQIATLKRETETANLRVAELESTLKGANNRIVALIHEVVELRSQRDMIQEVSMSRTEELLKLQAMVKETAKSSELHLLQTEMTKLRKTLESSRHHDRTEHQGTLRSTSWWLTKKVDTNPQADSESQPRKRRRTLMEQPTHTLVEQPFIAPTIQSSVERPPITQPMHTPAEPPSIEQPPINTPSHSIVNLTMPDVLPSRNSPSPGRTVGSDGELKWLICVPQSFTPYKAFESLSTATQSRLRGLFDTVVTGHKAVHADRYRKYKNNIADRYDKRICVGQAVWNAGRELPYKADTYEACRKCANKRCCPCVRIITYQGRYWLCWFPLPDSGVTDPEVDRFWAKL